MAEDLKLLTTKQVKKYGLMAIALILLAIAAPIIIMAL